MDILDVRLFNAKEQGQTDPIKDLENRALKRESKTYRKSLQELKEDMEGLKTVSVEFESLFLNMIFKSMRETTHPEEGLFGQSSALEIFQEMMDEEITKDASKAKSLGIADRIIQSYKANVDSYERQGKIVSGKF